MPEKIHEIRIIRKESTGETNTTNLKEGAQKATPQEDGSAQKTLTEIEWEAPEYVYEPKTARWYFFSAIVAALLIVYGVIEKNFLFIVLVMMGEILVLFWGTEKPPTSHYTLNKKKLHVNDHAYPLKRFQWFAVDEEGEHHKKLVLEPKAQLARRRYIYLDSPEFERDIRSILDGIIDENEEYEEGFVDVLAKFVRF